MTSTPTAGRIESASLHPSRSPPREEIGEAARRKWAVIPLAGIDTAARGAALRLAAHQHNEIRGLACVLVAHGFVRNDQRRPRRNEIIDPVHCFLRHGYPLERRFRCFGTCPCRLATLTRTVPRIAIHRRVNPLP